MKRKIFDFNSFKQLFGGLAPLDTPINAGVVGAHWMDLYIELRSVGSFMQNVQDLRKEVYAKSSRAVHV